MKFIQRAGIGLGAATSITVFSIFALFVYFIVLRDPTPSDANDMAITLAILWLFSLVVAIGAYYNAVKHSKIALVALCISGGILIVVLGFIGFFVFIWWGPSFGLLLYTPVILSFATIILAINSRLGPNL